MNRALTAIALAVVAAACSAPEEAPGEPALRPVRTVTVSLNESSRQRTFSGVSQSTQESRLSFKVSGTVTRLPVRTGTQLNAGDVIAELNRSSFDLEVQRAEASLAQAQASQRNADSNYERVKGLYAGSNASLNDLDTARANAESARAQVRSNRKALEIAQLNRSYTRLTVPEDCTVASLDLELNENVSTGQTVARVNCGTGIQVNVGIPESLIANLEEGMKARVAFNAVSSTTIMATVTEIGGSTSGGSATFPVVVTLDEAPPDIRSGMAAEVIFTFSRSDSNALVVPASAVLKDEQSTYVFVAVPDSGNRATVSRRNVQTGDLVETGIQIVSGLTPGDKVITAGTSVIRDGLVVLVPDR